MFSYYGSKSKIVDLYPKPKYDRIIEPFAGSARYSLKYWEKDILLVDKYDVIIDIWKWLQQCSKHDILSLPHLKPGQKTTDFNLSSVERNFLGFLVQRGVATPGITTSQWRDKNYSPTVGDDLKRIAYNLFKIRHWRFELKSYEEIKNQKSTWFIDPPYQFGGYKYKYSDIDFHKLALWCESRMGQVIVCENTKADWMNFKPMTPLVGTRKRTVEAIWSNNITNYDNEQGKLF